MTAKIPDVGIGAGMGDCGFVLFLLWRLAFLPARREAIHRAMERET